MQIVRNKFFPSIFFDFNSSFWRGGRLVGGGWLTCSLVQNI